MHNAFVGARDLLFVQHCTQECFCQLPTSSAHPRLTDFPHICSSFAILLY